MTSRENPTQILRKIKKETTGKEQERGERKGEEREGGRERKERKKGKGGKEREKKEKWNFKRKIIGIKQRGKEEEREIKQGKGKEKMAKIGGVIRIYYKHMRN